MTETISMEKECQQSEAFAFADGRLCMNLHQLLRCLKAMDESAYQKHITPERNDFAAWLESTLHYPDLATKFRLAKSKEDLIHLLGTIEAMNELGQKQDLKRPEQRASAQITPKPEIVQPIAHSNDQISGLQTRLSALRQQMSDCRKKGIDTKIPELLLMNAAPKLAYARVSGETKDLEKVEKILRIANAELSEAIS